ncbi:unnamed protein product (macronuclear) [Paramecium tetraurelia]|uniref:3-hydroxyisobutyryl-CoA hydrolase n=1 Tax=Paramecium tetraurelia TaxID=5888 RepID=A0EI73_PARTE|nr:uncharacterized protein GSPATT00027343001 [Paramecium tetraurelia]CAK95014.1 unnamed protein product [Paramecium tetraurelia]|eukprot:XP_001462387.1 hypothetical protein (macronuclear) [Paramecium tetraurelia strain d4-2]
MMLKIKYSYISTQVLRSQNVVRFDAEIKQSHLLGEKFGQQVFAKLNHNHKHNILTPTMLNQIHRFLESYDLDEAINIIWLDCQSKGTDLKYLQHLSQQEKIEYMRQIQNLAVYFGKYNKVLMPVITGEASGSMAALACSTPFQFFDQKGGIRFNDVNRGFVPHAGASYHLSRLPDQLGLYYALTGRWLKNDEALNLELIYGNLRDKNKAIDYIDQTTQQYKTPTTAKMYPKQVKREIQKFKYGRKKFLAKLSQEMLIRMQNEDAQQVAQELLYKLKRFQEENLLNQNEWPKQTIANPYLQFKTLNIDSLDEMGIISRENLVKLDKALIARCFNGESVQEIMDKLRAEQSQFAKEILTELEAQPKLSLDLTFKLLREAEKQQWRDCLVAEHNVASNLAISGLMEKQGRVDNIDSFFSHVSPSIDYLPDALEPVRDFYAEYPDNIRVFLNEENLRKGLIDRANQEVDVAAFMKNNQHMMDGSIRVSDLRKMRVELAELKRDVKIKMDNLKSIVGYEENLKKYIAERQAYLDGIKDFGTVLEETMNSFFEKANQARFNGYANVAKIASVKPKRELFSRVRNSILNHKLTTEDDEIEAIKKQQAWNRSMQRLLIFPKDDRKSFYENELPEKIVDNEQMDQVFRARATREKLYETRYGDLYQEFSQQMDKFYRNVVQNVTQSNKFANISEYLEGKEVKEILDQLKENKEEIIINLKKVPIVQVNKEELINQMKQEIEQLKQKEEIPTTLEGLINSDNNLSIIMEDFFRCPDQFKPLQAMFEQLLTSTYRMRMKNFEHLNELPIIDDQINEALTFDSFKVIENNLMFTFSYVLLCKLEEIYCSFKQGNNYEIQVLKFQQDFGFQIQNYKQFEKLIEYLNGKLRAAATLYNTYRQRTLVQSDKLLDYILTLKSTKYPTFKAKAIYTNLLSLKIKQHYENQITSLEEKPISQTTPDDVYSAIENKQYRMSAFYKQNLPKYKRGQLQRRIYFRDDLYMATKKEIEIYGKIQGLKAQKRKRLIIGINHQLKQLDLIAERQVEITPKEIQQQKEDLEKVLKKKWFSYQPIQQWFKELVQETLEEIYHPDLILSETEFKEYVYISFNAQKKLLELLRAELILGVQNERDEFIQEQKFNPELPEIQNLAQQLTVAESLHVEGLIEEIEPTETLFVGKKGTILKIGGQLPVQLNETQYRELRTKMIGRVEYLVGEWAQEPKLIDKIDIELLYDKIQQIQEKNRNIKR